MPGPPVAAIPLRERRRRELRGELSDTATRMFLTAGYDAVRVSDVARACGVTEKTVYNHFPTKESLLVDRWSPLVAHLEQTLANSGLPLLEVVEDVLRTELDALFALPPMGEGGPVAQLARFTELVRMTPALVAHEHVELERLTAVVAAGLDGRGAARTAPTRTDPVPSPSAWITASAVAGLFALFFRSLHSHVHGPRRSRSKAQVRAAVLRDLQEATDTLRHGL